METFADEIENGQNKEDASEFLQQKADLEKQKKEAEDNAVARENERDKKIKTIGNYVHESVPISDNEVGSSTPSQVSIANRACR